MSDMTLVSATQKGKSRQKTAALKKLISSKYGRRSPGNGVVLATLPIMSLSTYRTLDNNLSEISGMYISRPFSAAEWNPNVKLCLRLLVAIGHEGAGVPGFNTTGQIALEIASAAGKAGKNADACRMIAIRAYRLNRILAHRCRHVDFEQKGFKDAARNFEQELQRVQTLVQDVGRMSRSMQYWKQVALAEEIRLKLLESNSILDRCVELFTIEFSSSDSEDMVASMQDKLEHTRTSVESMVKSKIPKTFRISRTAPALPDELIGRNESLAKAIALITSTSGAKVAILGESGVGKTALALSILQHDDMIKSFGSHRYFVPCDSMEDPGQLITGILQIMGKDTTDPQTTISPLVKMQNLLSVSGNIFIVLDHFESLMNLKTPNAHLALTRIMEVLSMPSVTVILTIAGQYAPNIVNWNARIRLEPFDDALSLLKQAADDVILRNKLLLDFEMSSVSEEIPSVVTPKSSGHLRTTSF